MKSFIVFSAFFFSLLQVFATEPTDQDSLVVINDSIIPVDSAIVDIDSLSNQKIFISLPSGMYKDSVVFKIDSLDAQDSVYITFNGKDPQLFDQLYSGQIVLYRNQAPNNYSAIRSLMDHATMLYPWKEPQESVYKAHTIKARKFVDGKFVDKIYIRNYFVKEDTTHLYTFPVVALTVDSSLFYDYFTGIYIPGYQFARYGRRNIWRANYFLDTEVKAYFEYFDTAGHKEMDQYVGVETHGSGSLNMPPKSLRLHARSEYGDHDFDKRFFHERDRHDYKRLVLRNGGTAFGTTFFLDAMTVQLMKGIDAEVIYSQPVVVFVNGEYWGIHNLREHFNKYYFDHIHGLDKDSIDFLEFNMKLYVKEGDDTAYNQMIDFVEENDFKDESNYETLSSMIDISNFIDYNISKIYFGVYDWPGNNAKCWKYRSDTAKWRWLVFDQDDGFTIPTRQTFSHALDGTKDEATWPNPAWSTLILRKLFENDDFHKRFEQRYFELMTTNFSSASVHQVLDSMTALYQPEMAEHIRRWNYPESVNAWLNHIDVLYNFADQRFVYLTEDYYNNVGGLVTSMESIKDYELNIFQDGQLIMVRSNELLEKIVVHDGSGRLVYTSSPSNYYHQFTITTTGLYFVSIQTEHETTVRKLVIP